MANLPPALSPPSSTPFLDLAVELGPSWPELPARRTLEAALDIDWLLDLAARQERRVRDQRSW